MGSIDRRPNGKYRARFRDQHGKQHARHFDKLKDAREWLSRQVVKVTDGTWVDPEKGRRTFREYALEWQAAQVHHRDSTKRITRYRLQVLLDHFGDRPLAAITRSEVQAWVKSLDGMAPSSIEAHYRLLAQVMLAAVHDQRITTSPCSRINLPSRANEKITIPTVEDVAAVARAAPDYGRTTVLVAAGTGLRVSELLGLTVDRIDFLRGVITVDRQLLPDQSGVVRWGPPKTRASIRKVPIPRELVEVLAAHLAAHPSDGLVFGNSLGRPWTRKRHHIEWQRWCRAAGVEMRFHDLRHFYASSLIAAGQSVKVIQDRLGHGSATTTLDVYGHLFPADEEATRTAVTGVLGEVLRTVGGLDTANPQVSG